MSKNTPIIYIAHPVGSKEPTRTNNIAIAKLWLTMLVECVPSVAFALPWLPYVEVLDEGKHRERGIRDDIAMLRRCDGIVLVGGVLSPGMKIEKDLARDLHLPTIDLLELGQLDLERRELATDPSANLRALITQAFIPVTGLTVVGG